MESVCCSVYTDVSQRVTNISQLSQSSAALMIMSIRTDDWRTHNSHVIPPRGWHPLLARISMIFQNTAKMSPGARVHSRCGKVHPLHTPPRDTKPLGLVDDKDVTMWLTGTWRRRLRWMRRSRRWVWGAQRRSCQSTVSLHDLLHRSTVSSSNDTDDVLWFLPVFVSILQHGKDVTVCLE